MEKTICCFVLLIGLFFIAALGSAAQDAGSVVLKQQGRLTLSLELEIAKKNSNSLDRTISVIFGANPNAYATGFLDGLVMTAYHVVSGELSDVKKMNLGFKPEDHLDVKVYVKGCRANVIRVDKDADLALLEICGSRKQTKAPAFQTDPRKDEKLLLIARPRGDKMVSEGLFYGSYDFRGLEFWSAKLVSHDGYSGSPVYNHKAEVVGVFSGYDRVQDLALISPGIRAQKLLEDYISNSRP